MVTRNEKIKIIAKWYDIQLRKGMIREHFYIKFIDAIRLNSDKVVDTFYSLSRDELGKHKDWVTEYDLL